MKNQNFFKSEFFFSKKMKKEIRNEIKKLEMRERRNNRYLKKKKNNLSSLKEEISKLKEKIKIKDKEIEELKIYKEKYFKKKAKFQELKKECQILKEINEERQLVKFPKISDIFFDSFWFKKLVKFSQEDFDFFLWTL